MEKLRRIFPGLFVLVLALLVVLLPVREARAYDEPKNGVCPQCGKTLDIDDWNTEVGSIHYKCLYCCYCSEWVDAEGGSKISECTCKWNSEWTIDNENGTHYHKCDNDTSAVGASPCPMRGNETPHTVNSWTAVEGTNTHKGTCNVCKAEVTEEHNFSFSAHGPEGEWHLCSRCWATDGTPQEHHWDDKWCDSKEGTHYRRCTTCDEMSKPVAHEFVMTDIGGGYHQKKCVCGATEGDPVKCQFKLVDVGEGYHMSRCAVCDAIQEGTEAEPHQFGDWVQIDGTDTHTGVCACGAEKTEDCSGGTATCAAPAVCKTCGQSYGKKDPDKHDLVHHDTKAPTCTEIGWDAYVTCSRCDYTTYVEKKALDHDLEHHNAKPASCTEIGWKAYDTCKREGCDYTTYEEIDKLGHDLEHHDAKPATCTEDGWPAYDTCKREGCNYTTLLMMQAKLGHDLVHHEAKAATCTEVGWEAYDTCSRCDYSTYKEIPALGHDLVKHDAKAATCTEAGWDAYDSCSRCDYSTFKEIPALGHDIEHHAAKAATCTEDGWPAYDTCKREGCNYTTLLIMQARLGHDLVHHEAKAATCTEAGWEAYDTCKRESCDYTTYKEIPALGHDLTHHEGKAATCTEVGWDAYDTCSRCSYTTYREIAAPGHTPGEPVVTAREEPQVGKAGFEETIICCTVCGLELEYSYLLLPALPEPVPVPDTKEEGTGKPDDEIAIAPKKTVVRIIQPEFLEEEQELEHSVIQQIFSDDSGVYFQTEPNSVLPNIPPYALKLIESKVWKLERFSDLADRVILDYTGSQEFPLNLDLIMILVYRDDNGEHWEVLKKPTRLIGNRLRAEVDASLVRKLQSRSFAIIVLADNGSR